MTNGAIIPNLEEDPYNLEEITLQLIDDDEARKRTQSSPESQKAQKSEFNQDVDKGIESQGIIDDEILCELDNSEMCLSDKDDDIENEMSSTQSRSLYDEFLDSPVKSAARKCVSFKLSPSYDSEESIKVLNNFTRLKEKASSLMKNTGSSTEESCDIIPPTSSFSGAVKLRIANKIGSVNSDEEESSSEREDKSYDLPCNSSEKSSSSEEEDSDEGLFRRRKEQSQRVSKRRKPVSIPISKARTTALEEGRNRFRR